MPILDNQQRLARAGRIRMGERQGNRPVKLDNFRITSANRENLEQVALVYGGTVKPWDEDSTEDSWQVSITADEIDIVIPMSENSALSDYYELWSRGGMQRQCDSQYDKLNDKRCVCIAGSRECKPYTRLNVWMPKVKTLGTWLLTSTGYNSNAELGGVVTQIENIQRSLGHPVEATMRLDQRKKVADGKTFRFSVPVIETRVPLEGVLTALKASASPVPLPQRPEQPSIAAPPPPDAFPVPDDVFDEVAEVVYEGEETRVVADEPADTSMNVIAKNLVQQIVIACRSVGIDDDARHEMVSYITGGRTSSSKELFEGELPKMWDRMTASASANALPKMNKLWANPTVAYEALHEVEGLHLNVANWQFSSWRLVHEHCDKAIAELGEDSKSSF